MTRWNTGIWVSAGLLALLGLLLPVSTFIAIFFPGSMVGFGLFPLFLLSSAAIHIAALLLYSGGGWLVYLLSAILLAKALHSVYWLTVWDSTDDGLGYIWLAFPIFTALVSGALLSNHLTGKMKGIGLGYFVLVPALLIAVSARAQQVDFRQMTQARARWVSRAVETYYSRNGRYPQNLRQLPAGVALTLPEPVIIFGQNWCYEAGENYYRLGYVDREHWSDPRLIGRIYKTKGEAPALQPVCAPEVAAIQARSPDYPYTYWKESR